MMVKVLFEKPPSMLVSEVNEQFLEEQFAALEKFVPMSTLKSLVVLTLIEMPKKIPGLIPLIYSSTLNYPWLLSVLFVNLCK
jgi:hypothetical protein